MAAKQEVRSVDAFSQLPFIRPAATHQQQLHQQQARVDTTIRLFGRDFSNNTDAPQQQHKQQDGLSGSPDAANGSTVTSSEGSKSTGAAGAEASRKFECHYCCRNFPTSQALGGHQNAHKRERQHAKRAHLQASLAMHRYVPGAHMYGALLGYHHLATAARYDSHHHQLPPPHYPMWTAASAGGGGPGSVSQPIDGSPVVQGLWRVPPPPATEGFTAATPVAVARPAGEFIATSCRDDDGKVAMSLMPSSPSFSSCSSTSPEKLGRCELGRQQQQHEPLSLDLHL